MNDTSWFIFRVTWKRIPVWAHASLLLWFPWYYMSSQQLNATLQYALASIFVLTAHEFGHAVMARRRSTKVKGIKLYIFFGTCETETSYYEIDDVYIAWGGVLAQGLILIVSLLMNVVLIRFAPDLQYELKPLFNVLIYYNVFWILLNLLPVAPLDGHRAWRLIPLWRGARHLRRQTRLKRWGPLNRENHHGGVERSPEAITNDLLNRLRRIDKSEDSKR